mmetsp:Transcript_81739/g.210479  ORF Transcript_81739/g.210479 Transcript_81739/m.210479 type:complete len:147 (+) Transcript_81739:349-789(+)
MAFCPAPPSSTGNPSIKGAGELFASVDQVLGSGAEGALSGTAATNIATSNMATSSVGGKERPSSTGRSALPRHGEGGGSPPKKAGWHGLAGVLGVFAVGVCPPTCFGVFAIGAKWFAVCLERNLIMTAISARSRGGQWDGALGGSR